MHANQITARVTAIMATGVPAGPAIAQAVTEASHR
jgi:uncharacterized protein YoaH (UPF0181 family)